MLSTRLAASSALTRRSKPTLDRNSGEKSKVVLIATSSIEQHGYKVLPPDPLGPMNCRPLWASGNDDLGVDFRVSRGRRRKIAEGRPNSDSSGDASEYSKLCDCPYEDEVMAGEGGLYAEPGRVTGQMEGTCRPGVPPVSVLEPRCRSAQLSDDQHSWSVACSQKTIIDDGGSDGGHQLCRSRNPTLTRQWSAQGGYSLRGAGMSRAGLAGVGTWSPLAQCHSHMQRCD